MIKLFSVKLSVLLEGIAQVSPEMDCDITSITLDSREAQTGTLFVALKGTQQHGLYFSRTITASYGTPFTFSSGPLFPVCNATGCNFNQLDFPIEMSCDSLIKRQWLKTQQAVVVLPGAIDFESRETMLMLLIEQYIKG